MKGKRTCAFGFLKGNAFILASSTVFFPLLTCICKAVQIGRIFAPSSTEINNLINFTSRLHVLELEHMGGKRRFSVSITSLIFSSYNELYQLEAWHPEI